MRELRAATSEQAYELWPAARAARLFASREEFTAFRLAEPWRVRATERGEGAVVSAWRNHLEVLAIRGLWAGRRRMGVLAAEIVAVGADHGFTSVLSPLVNEAALEPYLEHGFRVTERLVVLQGLVEDILPAAMPGPVAFREAGPDDIESLAAIDAWCFDTFWGYRRPELCEALATERVVLAVDDAGDTVGYATCSDHGGSVTLGRLAVTPAARRRGVGLALLRDCARWATERDAFALTLCTQERNEQSRALYAAAGMHELPERYALAVRDSRGSRGAASPR